MDEGLSPRPQEPRRPFQLTDSPGLAGLPGDGSRDGLVMQILSTEHFSLLSHRSLVYNEAFTRVGMFLTFLSMSLVALALLSGALPNTTDLLAIAAIVLGFDLVIGLITLTRVNLAYGEDMLAVQGMARIRHGYTLLAPETTPFISTSTHDDLASLLSAYRRSPATPKMRANLAYGLSSSAGMASLVVALVGGALFAVLALMIGAGGVVALVSGAVGTLVVFASVMTWGYRSVTGGQRELIARFPAPQAEGPRPDDR